MDTKALYKQLKRKDDDSTYSFLENELNNKENEYAKLVDLKAFIKKKLATSTTWNIILTIVVSISTSILEFSNPFLLGIWLFVLMLGLICFIYNIWNYPRNIYLLTSVECAINNYNEKRRMKNEKKNS